MGEVWRARDTRLEREVAIKILPVELAADRQFRARFEREAKTISKLEHPHICRLYDVGEEKGEEGEPTSYLVMELLEGESLADRLERGPLRLQEVLRYGREIAQALDRAHRAGMIHRDLKPGNVMLTKSGAKLLDFGLARTGAEGRAPVDGLTNLATEAKPLTQEGTILGTFQYMAPEQLEGEEADARTDIFALGCVLYEMATGKRAFTGKSKTSLIAAIVDRDPQPMSELQPLTPPAFEHVVAKCLAKDPDERWQSAHDVGSELAWIGQAGSQAGVPTPIISKRKHRQRLSWILLSASLLLLVMMTGLWWRGRAAAPRHAIKLTVAIPDGSRVQGLAVSPDGSSVVYALWQGSHGRLYRRSLDHLDSVPIPGTDNAMDPFFSPDGGWIGYYAASDHELRKIPAAGGSAVTLAAMDSFRSGAWGGDGKIIFSQGPPSGLWSVADTGGTPVPISKINVGAKVGREDGHFRPFVLPGRRGVMFDAWSPGARVELSIAILPPGSDKHRLLFAGARPLYSRAGYLLYVSPRQNLLNAVPFDLKTLKTTGDPVMIAHDVTTDVALSPNGTLAYKLYHEPPERLVWLGAKGAPRPLALPEKSYTDLRLSPDGHFAALVISRSPGIDSGIWDIWVADLTRGTFTRLTTYRGYDRNPTWSPDGKWIVFTSDRHGPPNLYRVPAQGGNVERLTTASAVQHPGSFTPDGKHVLFSEYQVASQGGSVTKPANIARLDLDSGKTELLLHSGANETAPTLSPDGHWLAYISDDTGRNEIYLVSYPGLAQKRRVSVDGTDSAPAWSAAGRTLYYLRHGKLMAVSLERGGTLHLSDPRLAFAAPEVTDFDVAPDGRILAVQRTARTQRKIVVVVHWSRLLQQKTN